MTRVEKHSRPVPRTRAGGVMSGRSSAVTASEILGFLSSLRKSGMLWVETEQETFLVQLHAGAVVYAHGDLPPQGQRLGEILVKDGALSQARLEAALEAAGDERTVLGTYLVREQVISPGALSCALARQAQMIFDRMFEADDAEWQFEAGTRLVDSEDMRLNVIQLLLESARVNDEHRRLLETQVGLPIGKIMAVEPGRA